jgi:hypothetical protein
MAARNHLIFSDAPLNLARLTFPVPYASALPGFHSAPHRSIHHLHPLCAQNHADVGSAVSLHPCAPAIGSIWPNYCCGFSGPQYPHSLRPERKPGQMMIPAQRRKSRTEKRKSKPEASPWLTAVSASLRGDPVTKVHSALRLILTSLSAGSPASHGHARLGSACKPEIQPVSSDSRWVTTNNNDFKRLPVDGTGCALLMPIHIYGLCGKT